MPFDKGGICLAVTTGLEGCNTLSQPGNLFRGLFATVGSMVMSTAASFTGVLAGVGWAPLGVTSSGGMMGGFLQKSHTLEHILNREREVALYLLLEFYYAPHQMVSFTSSRQINLLHPELKGLGICHHLLMLDFLDIPAGKDRIQQQEEILLANTHQCWWSLMVIFYLALFTCPLWELKRGSYLMHHLFIVIHLRYHG